MPDRVRSYVRFSIGELVTRSGCSATISLNGWASAASLPEGLSRRLTEATAVVWLAVRSLTEVEPKDRAVVIRALRVLADAGCALLLTGHEVEDLLTAADEVIWMVAGTTHGLGPSSQARRHHQFRREYLGPGR